MREREVCLLVRGANVTAWVSCDSDGPLVTFDGLTYQSIPADSGDYRYTHGGVAYRAACEWYWAQL